MHNPTRRDFIKTAGAALATATIPAQLRGEEVSSLIRSIRGPLISVGDLGRQRELFEGVFGLAPVAEQRLDAAAVSALWGVERRTAQTVLLETPGTEVGVRLVAFEPVSEVAIREGAKGYDCDALKVVDFVASDFHQGVARLEKHGFELSGPPAEYTLPRDERFAASPSGRFTEGHLHGPDGVFCAVLAFHDMDPARYVKVVDRPFSEILGFSSPVAELEPVSRFYRGLGLDIIFQYEIETDSFQKLVGMGQKTRVLGTNFAREAFSPMLGIIHYGLPPGTYQSLRERAVLPNRGIAAVRGVVSSVEAVAATCREGGYEIQAGPTEVELSPYGKVRSLTVRAPHGVVHHFIET